MVPERALEGISSGLRFKGSWDLATRVGNEVTVFINTYYSNLIFPKCRKPITRLVRYGKVYDLV